MVTRRKPTANQRITLRRTPTPSSRAAFGGPIARDTKDAPTESWWLNTTQFYTLAKQRHSEASPKIAFNLDRSPGGEA